MTIHVKCARKLGAYDAVNRRTNGVLRGGHSADIGKATQFKRGNLGGGLPKKTPISEIFEELLADPKTRDAIKGQIRPLSQKTAWPSGNLPLLSVSDNSSSAIPRGGGLT
jgi:hypothetical protein